MTAQENPRIISFHYVLTDESGEQIDSSRESADPMTYLEGSGVIIPGLESFIRTLRKGDRSKITIPASNAYGNFDESLLLQVSRERFPKEAKIAVGDCFRAGAAGDGEGPVFTVTEVNETHIMVDGNHPLAGMDLTFDVEIVEAREPTAEELEHGHAHGPEGHKH